MGDEPLLFHTGPRGLFPLVAEAVATVIPVESLRWITFGHVEADECGAMNMWLDGRSRTARSPTARSAAHRRSTTCATGRPRPLADGEVIDLGGKRLRQISTPHVPHGWEAQVLFEETTGTLLCGDLFTQVGAAAGADHRRHRRAGGRGRGDVPRDVAGAPHGRTHARRSATSSPTTLALMHGPSFSGDGRRALLRPRRPATRR